jgi:hypothetical protein
VPASRVERNARLEYLALLAIASSLTSIWLALWVKWSLGAWFPGAGVPRLWPAGLALAGLASSVFADLALSRARSARRSTRAVLAGAGAVSVALLVCWAAGAPALAAILRGEPRLGERIASGLPVFLAALYAWWQGERLGRSPVGNQALRSAFYTGVTALAPLLVLNRLQAALSSGLVLGALMSFFGLSLSGLALSSLRNMQQQQSGRLMALALGREWLLTSGAIIGLVLGAGLLVARVAAPQALEQLAHTLAAVADSAGFGVGLVLGPLAAVVDWLLAPLLPGLAQFLGRFITALSIAIERLQGLFALLVQIMSFGLPRVVDARRLQAWLASPAFQAGARWAGVLVLLALAAAIFWLAARRLWGLQAGDQDVQRDSVLSAGLLLAQLKNLLNRRPRRRQSRAPDYLSLSGAPDDARLIVRRAYQAMLEWARSLRLPRAAGQTPRAYAQMLAGAVPEGHDAIDLLTQAYVLARYAAEAPSLEQARRAEGAMARLKALHS